MEPQQYCAYDGYPIHGGICNDCVRREQKAAKKRHLDKRRAQEQKTALIKQKETQAKSKQQEKELLKKQQRLIKNRAVSQMQRFQVQIKRAVLKTLSQLYAA